MREIKFRAWDKESSQMIQVNTLHLELSPIKVLKENDTWDWYKRDRVVMQYTGINDRNGKEIWEDDVVKGKRLAANGEFKRFIGKVVYRRCSFQIDGVGQFKDYFGEELHGVYEVIGNIYENPELLEAAADV